MDFHPLPVDQTPLSFPLNDNTCIQPTFHGKQLRRLVIAAGESFSALSLAALTEAFAFTNRLNTSIHFKVSIITPGGKPLQAAGGLILTPDGSLEAFQSRLDKGDLPDAVFVCTGFLRYGDTRQAFRRLLRSCKRTKVELHAFGAEVALLLQDNHVSNAATHWTRQTALSETNPNAEVSRTLFTRQGVINTCAGETAALDYVVDYIRQEIGSAEAAELCQHLLIKNPRSGDETQPHAHQHRTRNAPPALQKVIQVMRDNIEEPLRIADIAPIASVSIRQIERMFARHLKTSPMRYYTQLRLETARHLIRNTDMSMIEIALATGFGSASFLSKKFKEHYGTHPRSFRDF